MSEIPDDVKKLAGVQQAIKDMQKGSLTQDQTKEHTEQKTSDTTPSVPETPNVPKTSNDEHTH